MPKKSRSQKGQSSERDKRRQPFARESANRNLETRGGLKVGRSHFFLPLLILLVVLPTWTFWPVLSHQFLNWDDPINVTENPQIKSFTGENLKEIFLDSTKISKYYIPLTFLTFAFDHALFGLEARAFHRTNLILHIVNGLFVFWLFYLLTHRLSLAFFGATIFAVHPLQIEAVAWVTERKGLLAALFLLAALLSYRRYSENSSPSFYLGAIIFFLLSLLSKPTGLMLPFLLFLLDFFGGRRWERRVFYEKVPFFALTLLFGVLSFWGQQTGGAMGSKAVLSVDNLVSASYGLLLYLSRFFVPVHLSAFYPYPEGLNIIYLFLTGGFILGVWYSRKERAIFFGLTFFLFAILPVIKLVPFGDFIAADRLIYFPAIGLVFLAGCLLDRLGGESPTPYSFRKTGTFLIFLGILGILTGLSRDRVQVWHDSETLWKDVLQRYPNAAQAHTNLGLFYVQKGMIAEGISEYQKALSISPVDALTLTNLGVAYRKKGMLDEAILVHQKVLDLNPQHALAYTNLGVDYEQKGIFDESVSAYKKALALDPKSSLARTNLGSVLMKKGMVDEAIQEHRQAIALDPGNVIAQANLGVAYGEKGLLDEAIAQFQKSLALDPNYAKAHYNLAVAYLRKNEFPLATQHFQRAMDLGFKISPEIWKIIRGGP